MSQICAGPSPPVMNKVSGFQPRIKTVVCLPFLFILHRYMIIDMYCYKPGLYLLLLITVLQGQESLGWSIFLC